MFYSQRAGCDERGVGSDSHLGGCPAYHVRATKFFPRNIHSLSHRRCKEASTETSQKLALGISPNFPLVSMNSEEFRKAAHLAVDEGRLLLTPKQKVYWLTTSQSLTTSTLFKTAVWSPMSNQVIYANCSPRLRQSKEKNGRLYRKTSKRRSCPV